MKVRALTIGLSLVPEETKSILLLSSKLSNVFTILDSLKLTLQTSGYSVQTIRISTNSFEDWLLPLVKDEIDGETIFFDTLARLNSLLEENNIDFCSLGPATTVSGAKYISRILSFSKRFSCSVLMNSSSNYIDLNHLIAPKEDICIAAANICKEIAATSGDLGNFRFCAAFNCPPNTPFFPVAYHETNKPMKLTIGLENADLVFLSGFAASDFEEGRENLRNSLKQCILPIQQIAVDICKSFNIAYGGIDASINPGLSLPDSVGQGMETFCNKSLKFGSMGTLPVVSAITSALKALREDAGLILAGYSGLMLPVMEDLVLSQRANENPPNFSLRDLLIFSSICGVGIDTVPIPGESSPEAIAKVYLEVGTLAFRLNKPLTCRLLPMSGKVCGEFTEVDSPYLINTKVFSIE